MATVAVIVGAAVVNAIAFTAGNALYDKFGRTDGSEDKARHDRAIEDLQKASAVWNQKGLETLDFIDRSVKQKDDARNTFDDVNTAIEFYNQTHPDGKIVLPYRPVLEDFYKPTPEHNYHETVVASITDGVNGYVAYRFLAQ